MASRVLPIAHRGASGVAPENTKLAFVRALDMGAQAIEFDVQLTRDNVPIVFHDETLERTTDGKGVVADTDFADIEKLDAGSWFAPKFARTEVPTLEEVLSAIGRRALLNVELKPGVRIDRLAKHVVTAVARFDLFDTCVFSSFDPAAMRLMRKLVPEARIGILCTTDGVDAALRLADELNAQNLHPPRMVVDSHLVREAHDRGLNVWAWTANALPDIERLVNAGVDGIFSDYPDRVRTILNRTATAAAKA